LYAVVLILLVLGVILGASAATILDTEERAELAAYLQVFLRGLVDGQLRTEPAEALNAAYRQSLQTLGAIWFLGLTGIGAPVVGAIVFMRGLVVGFTVGFLVKEMGMVGLFLAALGVLPQNLLALPAITGSAVAALAYSLRLLRRRTESRPRPLLEEILAYTFVVLLMAGLLLGAGLIEAYLSPALMRLVASHAYP
jgi:stage II sporulation protein M